MRIALVAAELAPFSRATGLGGAIADLGTALVTREHEVHVVAPISPTADPGAYSLAKRLRPIAIESSGRAWAFDRFDGRTTSGLQVHLLGDRDRAEQIPDLGYWDAFCSAAAEVLGSLDRSGLCCVSWNAECATLAAADRAGPAAAGTHLLTISRLDEAGLERITGALDALDRVVIAGRLLADTVRSRGLEPLGSMLADGRAQCLPLAQSAAAPIHRADKASAKAALQAALGLPVRRDVPLVVLAEPPARETAGALARFLTGDVQAAAMGGPGIDELVERYGDRLALLRGGRPLEEALLAADGGLFTGDPTLAARCMSRGAIPVTTAGCGEGVVDLEPSLESGSGMIAQRAEELDLAEALGRLAAAFRRGDRFCELTERVPGYVTTWDHVSRLYEQLIEAPIGASTPAT